MTRWTLEAVVAEWEGGAIVGESDAETIRDDAFESREAAHDALGLVAAQLEWARPLGAALKRMVRVVSEDGHGFHDGTELGKALNNAMRVLRAASNAGLS